MENFIQITLYRYKVTNGGVCDCAYNDPVLRVILESCRHHKRTCMNVDIIRDFGSS